MKNTAVSYTYMEQNKLHYAGKQSSKNKYLVGLILFFVIALGLILFINNKNNSRPSVQGVIVKEQTVRLTNAGFAPNEVTIKEGEAVRWINETDEEHASVNSDDYPTNQKYPELNLGEFQKGSTLVHIFTKKGTYTYHNYFHPTHKGTVIVQ